MKMTLKSQISLRSAEMGLSLLQGVDTGGLGQNRNQEGRKVNLTDLSGVSWSHKSPT